MRVQIIGAAIAAVLASGAAARSAEAPSMDKARAALLAFYPAEAKAAGFEGVATISCGQNEHLALRDCTLVSEFPPAQGFGRAALAMAAKSPDQPAATVAIPPRRFEITVHFTSKPFDIAPNLLTPRHLITNPDILTPPSPDILAKAYPVQAVSGRIEGVVRLKCVVAHTGDLTNCGVDQESPPGYGFGDAALKIAPAYRMRPRTVDGAPVDAASVIVPIRFAAPRPKPLTVLASFPTENAAVNCPATSKTPDAYYPDRARRLNVEGTAQIACGVDQTGKPHRCTWTAEAPPNNGFGPAAAQLGCLFKLEPRPDWTGETIVSLPMRFAIPPR